MALQVSEVVLLKTNSCGRESDEIYDDYCHELKFLAGEEPKTLVKKESLQREKQISVDPVSLRGSSARQASFNLMLQPVISPPTNAAVPLPPSLQLAKPKFLSCSLPNSTTSSPRFSSILSKKKWKNESQASPRQVDKLSHRHSNLGLVQDDTTFQRSKSCGEGRASTPSADEFDLWLHKPNACLENDIIKHHGRFSKTGTNKDHRNSGKNMDPYEDGFKCGALCLCLPGFGKGKPVRARKEETVVIENVISRTVSLEKFECGSWASSAIIQDEEGESMNPYFDLPLEFIRSGVNDAHSPVSAAFVFDKDVKGVLKNGSKCAARKSGESPRHVRFSTSSSISCPASPVLAIRLGCARLGRTSMLS